jgi:hypothetical protein
VAFQVKDPATGIKVTGRERVRILADGLLRIQARVDPGAAFQSKRISVNLILNSDDYQGKQFILTRAGETKATSTPDQPLFPIQFATNVQRLVFPTTGIQIHPLGGIGVLEDLRHYQLGEFWYEQEASYPYPAVAKDASRYIGMDVRFRDPATP